MVFLLVWCTGVVYSPSARRYVIEEKASISTYFVRAGERTRTADPLFTRQALYQLSYSGLRGSGRVLQL